MRKISFGIALALWMAGCSVVAKPPVVAPPAPPPAELNSTISGADSAQSIDYQIVPDTSAPFTGRPTGGDRFTAQVPNGAAGRGADVDIKAPGYIEIRHRLKDVQGNEIPLPPTGAVELLSEVLHARLPPPPTRQQLLTMQVGMYGLRCVVPSLGGDIPWFDPGIQALGLQEREAVYGCKKARGDTGIITGPGLLDTILYDEPDNPYQVPIHPFDIAEHVTEHAENGLWTDLALDGDGSDFQRAFDELPVVLDKLLHGGPTGEDLTQYVTLRPGWDGVFYSCAGCWDNDKIQAWAAEARRLCPQCTLVLEFSTGHIPLGEGGGDFLRGGRMKDFDGVLVEFDMDLHNDNTWQILARLLGPAYNKPADDPNGSAPCYTCVDSVRGPWGVQCFEPPTYLWVRERVTQQRADDDRKYLKTIGCPVVD